VLAPPDGSAVGVATEPIARRANLSVAGALHAR